jgi:hypothetical protein
MASGTATICDDCSLVAYDHRVGIVDEFDYDDLDEFDKARKSAWQAQVDFMVSAGDIFSDHACSAQTEPELQIRCNCGCRRGARPN